MGSTQSTWEISLRSPILKMNSKISLILLGLLVTLAVLAAAENSEENSLSEEIASLRLVRSADADAGKRKKKSSKKYKKSKKAAKKSKKKAGKRKNKSGKKNKRKNKSEKKNKRKNKTSKKNNNNNNDQSINTCINT